MKNRLRNFVKRNNRNIFISLTEEEYKIINNALCLYGVIVNEIDMFDRFETFSFEDGEKTANLMKKIGDEL